jgi:uncharacterized membrane protein YqjE
MSLLYALPRMVPLLARHALGYVDLAAEELDGIAARLRRRVLAGATCILATFLAVATLACLAIAMAWDTPYRYIVIAGLALFFLALAIATGDVARRERRNTARVFERLRDEWLRDRETLRDIIAERNETREEDRT